MLILVGHGLFKSVNRAFPYLGRGCIVALATVSILATELSASTTRSAAPPHATPVMEVVKREHKADRLPMARIERPNGELPVGCESVVSTIGPSPLANIARQCLS
jgi:hypothetical protein